MSSIRNASSTTMWNSAARGDLGALPPPGGGEANFMPLVGHAFYIGALKEMTSSLEPTERLGGGSSEQQPPNPQTARRAATVGVLHYVPERLVGLVNWFVL